MVLTLGTTKIRVLFLGGYDKYNYIFYENLIPALLNVIKAFLPLI